MSPARTTAAAFLAVMFGFVPALTEQLSAEEAPNWAQFGGPHRDFTLRRSELHSDLLEWPVAGPREIWQHELGDGYAGIVVARGKLVTMFRKDDRETIIALDPDTGRELWTYRYACPFEGWEYGSGAFSTPIVVGNRVYCVGIMSMLHCLDLDTGAVIWKHDLLREFGGRIPGHGYGCSPIAVGDLIVLSVGGPADDYTMDPIAENSGDSIFAFDGRTGAVVWSALNYRIRHASPILITLDDEPQLVLPLYEHVVGLNPQNGKQLWDVDIPGHTNVTVTPVWHPQLQLLVTANSYGTAKGLHAIQLQREGTRTIATRVWDNARIENWHSSMVLSGSELTVSAGAGPAFLTAVNLEDGTVLTKQRGFGKTNIVKLADQLLLLDERGAMAMARRTDNGFEILGTAEVFTSGRCWTAPSVVGDTIYVRNKHRIKALRFR